MRDRLDGVAGVSPHEAQPRILRRLDIRRIETFPTRTAPRFSREDSSMSSHMSDPFCDPSLGKGVIATGLETEIDTPRTYQGEHLPCSLSWKTVQSFLARIGRSTSMARATTRCSSSSRRTDCGRARSPHFRLDDVE